MYRMPTLLVGSILLLAGCAAGGGRVTSGHGVRVIAPKDWSRVRPASDAPVSDPRTLLVVGTAGVQARASGCQVASYRIPSSGAAVIVVGWSSVASAGGAPMTSGRGPLRELVAVTRPSFECFAGRGAVADVALGGR